MQRLAGLVPRAAVMSHARRELVVRQAHAVADCWLISLTLDGTAVVNK